MSLELLSVRSYVFLVLDKHSERDVVGAMKAVVKRSIKSTRSLICHEAHIVGSVSINKIVIIITIALFTFTLN